MGIPGQPKPYHNLSYKFKFFILLCQEFDEFFLLQSRKKWICKKRGFPVVQESLF